MEIQDNHRNFKVPIKQLKIRLLEDEKKIALLEARIKQLEEKIGVQPLPVEPEKEIEPVVPKVEVKRKYNKIK